MNPTIKLIAAFAIGFANTRYGRERSDLVCGAGRQNKEMCGD